ncbi:MAG: MotA/TolQ/ExbB proton channel family protein [Planctomycetaceae bacterium]|nr:MotA/TolQ/ExbB proton channel family protein [Planctomycetaceae bacterium]
MSDGSITLSPVRRTSRQAGILSNAILWGMMGCFLFYGALPFAPVYQGLLIRYTCGHPLEYITMALFFCGIATLFLRWRELQDESRSLNQASEILTEASKISTASQDFSAELLHQIESTAAPLWNSVSIQRLKHAAEFVRETASTENLDSHLRHCAELDLDRAQQKLGLVNTISWAIPIVGFLGTVMGITIAIANVSPEQLDQSLTEVTSGLGVAFDTTALSLSLSLVLVFATYLIRSRQDDLLNRIEEQIDRQLAIRFRREEHPAPVAAQVEISQNLVAASEQIVSDSVRLWRETLSDLKERMTHMLHSEQVRMTELVEQNLDAMLTEERQHREDLRQTEAGVLRSQISGLDTTLSHWNEGVAELNQSLHTQAVEQKQQTILLQEMISKQQQLTELQARIDESINTREITNTLDQTLNSLTAAIQLLNARVGSAHRAA